MYPAFKSTILKSHLHEIVKIIVKLFLKSKIL